ncbi:hypothetical protein BCR33DRAFT_721912 [Rhizoclosmatium globosum]|uniref:Uncharacterized protein n=1 Tax=Rhizoclosmatium globosum TaxID=329046 RepID=A0A1Y2BRC4_9FUNG|nr:hypothetical protein BCR33DRAFT_721912 [Rhizoclosmatium globosum]|eukprot:ORY36695.1 hypothetical protein BCR33DRAFT_721912 [Rhizoclosmatium globosum]
MWLVVADLSEFFCLEFKPLLHRFPMVLSDLHIGLIAIACDAVATGILALIMVSAAQSQPFAANIFTQSILTISVHSWTQTMTERLLQTK